MEEGRDLVSVMEDATRAFKLHMGTMKAWDFKFVPHGFVREHRHKGNSILDNEADIIPDIEDAEADQEDVKDDLDAEGDDAGSGAEDEKMEEGMKTLLFETLGPPLDEKIKQLFAISPASPPLGLATTAYPHQLYAAARLAHLARSTYCGGILADDMGFGKTRSSVLATIAAKRANGEGVVLIVTKKSLITTWKDEIINMFTDEKKPKIIIPTAQASPQELHKYDYAITNYEHIVAQYSSIDRFIRSFSLRATTSLKRPAASIISATHALNGQLFRVVFDEAHIVKGVDSITNMACRAIPKTYSILITGTPFYNSWIDSLGLLQLLKGHPFTSMDTFLEVFGSKDKKKNRQVTPTTRKMLRIQKFMMSMTIARPLDTLELKPITIRDVHFELDANELAKTDILFARYSRAQNSRHRLGNQATSSALRLIVQAVQEGTHPTLRRNREGDDRSYAWLDSIKKAGSAAQSSRMQEIKGVFLQASRDYPGERIIFTSEHVGVLDITSLILEEIGITPIFYDGRTSAADRATRLERFKTSAPGSSVLLLTPGTGGTGLNVPEASIMVQAAPWWNANTESQMYSRMRRPGQPFSIKVSRIIASNSKAESLIVQKQRLKATFNERLMAGLRWRDQGPVTIPLVVTPKTNIGDKFKGSWRE